MYVEMHSHLCKSEGRMLELFLRKRVYKLKPCLNVTSSLCSVGLDGLKKRSTCDQNCSTVQLVLVTLFKQVQEVKVFILLLQEVLVWVTKLRETLGGDVTDEQLRNFIWNTLKSGQVWKLFVFF